MKTLYKLDTKGKCRILQIITEGSKIVQVSGLLDGAKTTNYSECVGKNIGRSNETTPEQQAILEAESKITERLKEGYFETLEEAQGGDVILPMLALDIKKLNGDIDWTNCYVQRKYDGQRVLAIKKNGKVKLLSRSGREIVTLQHIVEQLEELDIPDNIYDGEAFNLEVGSFQEQMKSIKKYTKGLTEKVDYNIYDIILDKPFRERFQILKTIFNENV